MNGGKFFSLKIYQKRNIKLGFDQMIVHTHYLAEMLVLMDHTGLNLAIFKHHAMHPKISH